MAFVRGYQHDVFISYAHEDDREWVNRLIARLEPAIKQRLGVKPSVWIEDEKLRASRDFSNEIPESVRSSAAFVLLPSPTYVRSRYCVDVECKVFAETYPARRARFAGKDFANELFAFRCPILPVDGNEHWTLFEGLTDIPFCDEADTFATGSPPFEASFRRLVGELVDLLKRMRNHSTAVFLYPPQPGPDLQGTRTTLADELSAQSYRLLPDRTLNLPDQLREAAVAVFLLGSDYDERAGELAELAAGQNGKPWLVWCSPTVEQGAEADQVGLSAYLEQLDAPNKTYLNASINPAARSPARTRGSFRQAGSSGVEARHEHENHISGGEEHLSCPGCTRHARDCCAKRRRRSRQESARPRRVS